MGVGRTEFGPIDKTFSLDGGGKDAGIGQISRVLVPCSVDLFFPLHRLRSNQKVQFIEEHLTIGKAAQALNMQAPRAVMGSHRTR